jgi:5-oxoprolinase (ATP-hydrolysing)
MSQIQTLAAETVRSFFQDVYKRFGGRPLIAQDFMDDGTLIRLAVRIKPEDGSAVFDWTGTGPQTHGNFNCPISLSYAAIIYCLRSMIKGMLPRALSEVMLMFCLL